MVAWTLLLDGSYGRRGSNDYLIESFIWYAKNIVYVVVFGELFWSFFDTFDVLEIRYRAEIVNGT